MVGAVTGLGIEQKIANVDLDSSVGGKRIGNYEINGGDIPCRDRCREEIAHLPGVTANTRFFYLDLPQHPISGRINGSAQGKPEGELQVKEVGKGGSQKIKTKDGKREKLLWCGTVFVPQLGKAVVGGDKKVVAADTIAIPKRRTVGRDTFGQSAPLQLLFVGKLLPRPDGPLVKGLLLQLFLRTGKVGVGFALEIADTVPMVIGNIADRGPAV